MQIKTRLRYYHILTGMAKIWNDWQYQVLTWMWRNWNSHTFYSWEYKVVQPLWKTIYHFLTQLPYACYTSSYIQNKKQRHHFANKGLSSQSYGFSSSHVWMWELNHKESWGPKNWCFWTVVLEKTLESPLDCKEIQPVHPKGNQSWIFIGRTDAEAETPVLWPPEVKSWLTGKDPDAGKDRGQEEKGMAENEMVGWHHQFDRLEFEQALGDDEGQESLACCSP